jgi:hypothetical protein
MPRVIAGAAKLRKISVSRALASKKIEYVAVLSKELRIFAFRA